MIGEKLEFERGGIPWALTRDEVTWVTYRASYPGFLGFFWNTNSLGCVMTGKKEIKDFLKWWGARPIHDGPPPDPEPEPWKPLECTCGRSATTIATVYINPNGLNRQVAFYNECDDHKWPLADDGSFRRPVEQM